VDKWDQIYNIFSKEAVLNGSFDNYVESKRKKRGTSSVDDEFLHEIEQWREILARNIALRNKELTIEDLNFAVQQIIDRIVFLRMCEDRGVEKYEQLRDLLDNDNIYLNFCKLCKKADEKYNSGLFHFKEEKGRGSHPDKLTLDLNIDDGVLKNIIKTLYYPNSPYEFSVLPAEILGNVYEQFLGKVIRLTPGHQAKVEEKPEVKKAGGVYYTPQFIVDYIVENTVGKLCKGKTPKKVSELRILDPACGSGSFLLGAYNYLLKWHLDYYSQKDSKRLSDQIYKGKDNQLHLTIQEKKRILLNNIYGVDIDSQAVEVTKLSLLLKVLEGENKDALEAQQKLFQERALPDLENNIKCGNSLIESDIYYNNNFVLNDEDITRINPFDWEMEFKGIDKFDAIIGNPPYLSIQTMSEWTSIEPVFYKDKYNSASEGNYDIYVVFVEKALELLNEKGILGYILPHRFFLTDYGEPLRDIISNRQCLEKIVHFGEIQIFDKITTYTCLLFLKKKQMNHFEFSRVSDIKTWIKGDKKYEKFHMDETKSKTWTFVSGKEKKLKDKLGKLPNKLVDQVRIFQGLATSDDKLYILKLIDSSTKYADLDPSEQEGVITLEKELLKPVLRGGGISRYRTPKYKDMVIFPYKIESGKAKPISLKELKSNENTFNYLNNHKERLLKRSNCNSNNWWLYPYPKNLKRYEKSKILIQVLSKNGNFFLDSKGEYYFTGGGNAGGNAIQLKENDINSLELYLGILNSKVTSFFVSNTSPKFKGQYFSFGKKYLGQLPLPNLTSEKPILCGEIVSLVNKMIELNLKLEETSSPDSKKIIQRRIDATDKQIDKLVYELYGLTDEEIQIIEDSINS